MLKMDRNWFEAASCIDYIFGIYENQDFILHFWNDFGAFVKLYNASLAKDF
jgi:hypothetical protein